jgi:hypothetical protein
MPLAAILAAGFASDYGEGTQRFVISAAVGIAVIVVWITLLALGQRILRFARQLVTRSAVAGLQKDCRAPIVYLRAFERDVKGRATADACDPIEDDLSYAFAQIGPPIGLGKPGEKFATPGVMRAYVTDKHWQEAVQRITATARAVVYVAGTTHALRWELQYIKQTLDPRRLLLLITWTDPDERDFLLKWCENTIAIRLSDIALPHKDALLGLDLVVFDKEWRPRSLRHVRKRIGEGGPRFRELRTGLKNSVREALQIAIEFATPFSLLLSAISASHSPKPRTGEISLRLTVEPFTDRLRTL